MPIGPRAGVSFPRRAYQIQQEENFHEKDEISKGNSLCACFGFST